jgi:hypothetical protein
MSFPGKHKVQEPQVGDDGYEVLKPVLNVEELSDKDIENAHQLGYLLNYLNEAPSPSETKNQRDSSIKD